MGGFVKSIVNTAKSAVKNTVNIVKNTAEGDIGSAFKSATGAVKDVAGVTTGFGGAKGAAADVQKGLADLTGATAAQEQLQMQAELSRRESRRQALLSDALARSEGGEGARVITGGRRKKTSGAASTGISGASGSRGTGVQG